MTYVKRAIFIVLLGYLSQWIYFWLLSLHVGMHHLNHRPGPCKVIPGVECGSEKIVATKDGLGFVTSGFKLLTPCPQSELEGRIYSINMNRPEDGATLLEIDSETIVPKDFSPHGMDLVEDEATRTVTLYVVSHNRDLESIEVFVYSRSKPSSLKHVESITDKEFAHLNDLAMVDDGSFYATNFLSAWSHASTLITRLEVLLQLNTGNVIYYDRKRGGRVVSSGLALPNGITLSEDKRKLFVSAVGNTSLIVYNRNETDNNLRLQTVHQLWYPVDNIVYDRLSHYIYGAHVKGFYKVFDPRYSGEGVVPSSVLQIKPRGATWEEVDINEIFHDDGQLISAASTGYHYKRKIFIGTVYHKLAYCDVIFPTDM